MSRNAINQGCVVFFSRGAGGTPPCNGYLLQENGGKLLQENGDALLIASICPPGAILLEDGGALLQEDGFKILQ